MTSGKMLLMKSRSHMQYATFLMRSRLVCLGAVYVILIFTIC